MNLAQLPINALQWRLEALARMARIFGWNPQSASKALELHAQLERARAAVSVRRGTP